jgi:hypothetical protein
MAHSLFVDGEHVVGDTVDCKQKYADCVDKDNSVFMSQHAVSQP